MRRIRTVALVVLLLATAVLVRADMTASSIPFAPHGDPMHGASGAIVPLTSSSFLVPAEGPDGDRGTADDVVLLVRGAGTSPTVTALAVPFQATLPTNSTSGVRLVRLSATRAVVPTAGPDGKWATDDDVVALLADLGSLDIVADLTVPCRGPASERRTTGST